MAYQPPIIYQQGAPYPPGSFPGSQPFGGASLNTQSSYTPAPSAGWMAGPPAGPQAPYPQQQTQQPYPSQQPYQQPYQHQQQQTSYGQQQAYAQQQPYPQQQQASPAAYGQNRANQHYSQQQPQYQPPTTYQPHPTPSGRKKALLIGCCYPGTSAALNGCINDVQCIEYCLKHRFGFTQPGSIVVLRDDQRKADFVPTKANILRGIQWLMMDQRPGDSLFFHFSGHGSQKVDTSGDELDGYDETILPTDHKRAGQIVDDELNALMVRPLQPGVVLHALIDACHSGTAMDLPYRAKIDGGKFNWKLKSRKIKGTSGGTAFQFGACKDSQVAADTNGLSGSAYTGAATFSFIEAVEKYGAQQTYASLLQHMMDSLQKRMGGSSAGGLPGGLGALTGGGGGLAGAAVGLMANFLLGGGALGAQIPVICCDKQVDLYATRLGI